MKQGLKILLVIIIFVLIALGSVYTSNSTTVNAEIFSGESGLFLARYSGKNIFIAKATPDNISYTYTLPENIIDSCVVNGKAYILTENTSRKNSVYIYTASDGNLKSYLNIQNIKVNASSKICADKNGGVYIKTSSGSIMIYEKSGKLIKTVSDRFIDLIPFQNYTLAYNDKNIYIISQSDIKIYKNPSKLQLYKISDNYIADTQGRIYKFNNGFTLKADLGYNGLYHTAVTEKFYICFSGNYLTAYTKSDLKEVSKIRINKNIDAVYPYKNKIAVITEGSDNYSVSVISENQFQNSSADGLKNADSIKLDKYTHTKKYIFINLGTTIADFKSNITYNGFTIDFPNRRSGKLKTGNTVRFTKDSAVIEYTFIVKGDVTGDGNVNSRDENAMFNHLLGESKLTGIKKLAGDINRDNKISNADLVLLSKIIL